MSHNMRHVSVAHRCKLNMGVHAGVSSYLADAELQLQAHFKAVQDLSSASNWLLSIDNMGFAAGRLCLCTPSVTQTLTEHGMALALALAA